MMHLGLLFGGQSFEHEISIVTAFQIKKRLEAQYEIHLIYFSLTGDIWNADQMSMKDFRLENYKKLKPLKIKKMKLDALVGALHGENGEDGLGYAFARLNHIRYVGCDMLAASLCMDKYRSYLYLNNNGISMIPTTYYTYQDYLDNKKIDFYPCIVKPIKGGSSLGIVVIEREEELEEKLLEAFQFGKEFIIQPYYNDLEEYNLAVSEDYFSNLEKINKKDSIFSFENKYSDSFKVMHQSLVDDEKYEKFCAIARRVYELLGAHGIIRIDFFYLNDTIYVNEVNTTPGALAMYLFPDFDKVFEDCLNKTLLEEEKNYPKSHYLVKNNINK